MTAAQAAEAAGEEVEEDPLDRELDRIRQRRTGQRRFFRGTFDDLTLVVGVISGIVFFGGMMIFSTGFLAPDSIVLDQTLSKTPLDRGGECLDREGEVWINIWGDHDMVVVKSNNAPAGATIVVSHLTVVGGSEPILSTYTGGSGDIRSETNLDESIPEGEYHLTATLYQLESVDSLEEVDNQSEYESISDSLTSLSTKDVDVEVKTVKSGSLFNRVDAIEAHVNDDDPRSCFTMEQMGEWGWVLMGAEWVGGRETAMLLGGNAGVPAWWLAFISLGMSIFFLCVQYPLMHRLYHRDADDLLSKAQTKRLIERTIFSVQGELRCKVDYEQMRLQDRPISIDVIVPYKTTGKTIASPIDVRAEITKELLEEFAVFGEMRPLQLKVVCTDSTANADFTSLGPEFYYSGATSVPLAEDYGPFFSGVSAFGRLDSTAHESLARWFRKHDLVDFGSAVMADEEAVFVRVIYRPVQRFAYFLFKPTYKDLQDDLEEHLRAELEQHIAERSLVVSARNEKSTIADRAAAGRVEQGVNEFTGEAMVAKRGGIAGALLQNPFMGDILSSVEYVAHKNQDRIDRFGYWGLIVFVWIPFMASGVLVGAMLGLVARMPFERVLAACLIGGTAASLTWAYTARGIIEFMERYHAEAVVPVILLIAVAFTWLKIRDNRIRRREELFRDSMAFFSGASE
ncbi:MAG: small multi-drug export protein [Candidatus Thermoplasmatota archaeon]|nr:small multi-drug export protein [Candidatus Thermoplasmatota archaeon]MEE3315494.1 small multi-drug export protein [Candidatus Thermoplasmatota archaeon]